MNPTIARPAGSILAIKGIRINRATCEHATVKRTFMQLYKFTRFLSFSVPLALALGVLGAALTGHAQSVSGPSAEPPSLGLLRHLAVQGDSGAQMQLGLAYRDGREGLPADQGESVRWLERAANSGQVYAADALANVYATGTAALRSRSAALHWWQVAANGGNADAAYQLGRQLAADQPQQARHWLQLAAERGDRRAEQQLQRLYRQSLATAADLQLGQQSLDTLAAQLDSPTLKVASALWNLVDLPLAAMAPAATLRASAEQGDPVAEYQVAMRYLDGAWELRRDPEQGRYWLQRAAADGNPLAEQTLADIGAHPI
jgi:TPR repeat protein